MVGSKLNLLKKEIDRYIGIPYFSNTKKIISPHNSLVGKGSWKEITSYLPKDLDPKKRFSYLKKRHLGIDCSGLVYHLLDYYSRLKFKKSIYDQVVGTDNKHGVRRVSADLFTSPINSIPIKKYTEIKTGDLIRHNNGKHVILIVKKIRNIIYLVHSSQNTTPSGVHYAAIEITNPQKSLKFQKWSDKTKDGTNYAHLFNSKTLDGIYRPKVLL